ncbi:hypothetical protein C8Q78DRAFT_1029315 [Trametes maxima]|nr:hypothetical protein C8Q78DRAFT_1029315 [Trametes maxima]
MLANVTTRRRELGIPLRKRRLLGGDEKSEVKVFCVLRMIATERLQPLQTLTRTNFVTAWFQCAEVHYLNWRNNIHHKDLSLNNLMYRERDGSICGVMNDWYLAVDVLHPQTRTGSEVTGTTPFMAIDLLQKEALCGKVQYFYHHDLEAFMWIFIWVVCCYEDGKRRKPVHELYDSWISGNMLRCRMSKLAILDLEVFGDAGPTSTWTAESWLAEDIRIQLRRTRNIRREKNSAWRR